MRRHLFALSALAPLALMLPSLAAAQDASGEKVNSLIVYGDDPCPASQGADITVCARKPESERYRIPPNLRESGDLQKNEAWNNKVLAYETVGAAGTNSCSPVGAGGWTGCQQKLIANAYAEKAQSSDVRFSELIAEERAKRLSTIDSEAAATQARVEQAEKEYQARQNAQEAAEDKTPDPPRGNAAAVGAGRPGQ